MNKSPAIEKTPALVTIWLVGLSPLLLTLLQVMSIVVIGPMTTFAFAVCSSIVLVLLSTFTPTAKGNTAQFITAGLIMLGLNLLFIYDALTQTVLEGFGGVIYLAIIPVFIIVSTVVFANNLSKKY